MAWEHKEQTLQQRILTHEQFAKYEINDWILSMIQLKLGESILDLGCGNGKQLLEYAHMTAEAHGRVEGMDISENLLKEAKLKLNAAGLGDRMNVRLKLGSADDPLPYSNGTFDVVSCCFSIYYYKDIEATLKEIKRVLKPNGRFFVAAPTRHNIGELTSLANVEMKYINRTESEIIPNIIFTFNKTTIEIFKNPVTFPDMKSFNDYFRSALAFKDVTEVERGRIISLVDSSLKTRGEFTMHKHVYGIIGSSA
jgi:ubiquinone/menaquinone biosynthesis C-methylase UbiE